MGITISSPNHSIDLGYVGFQNLRNTIAKLVIVKDCINNNETLEWN